MLLRMLKSCILSGSGDGVRWGGDGVRAGGGGARGGSSCVIACRKVVTVDRQVAVDGADVRV